MNSINTQYNHKDSDLMESENKNNQISDFDENILDLRETGAQTRINEEYLPPLKRFFTLSTQELIMCSILSIMGGFISGLIPFSLLIKTWYPLLGGTQLVSGHHILWGTLAYAVTKRKFAIILTSLFQGFLVFLLGSSWGIFEIVIQLYEGFWVLIGFIIIEKLGEKDSTLGWGLACGFGNMTQVPLFWYITGKIFILHWAFFLMSVIFAFISGFFIAGVLSKKIMEQIEKANIL